MKTIKRFFLKIPYLFYVINKRLNQEKRITFNAWLSKHGHNNLTNYLDLNHLNINVPVSAKEILEMYKNIPYIPMSKQKDGEVSNTFHWYEN